MKLSAPNSADGFYYDGLLRDAAIEVRINPFYYMTQDEDQRKDVYVQTCVGIDSGRRRYALSDYVTFYARIFHAHRQSDEQLFKEKAKRIRPRKKTRCEPMYLDLPSSNFVAWNSKEDE